MFNKSNAHEGGIAVSYTHLELPIRCYVYKDGELINNNGNYTLSYKWTGVNIELREGENDDRKIASGTT